MELGRLCEECDDIDFHAAGFHAPNDLDYNFFAMDEIPFPQVTAKVEECAFCEMVSAFLFQWAEANYEDVECLALPEAQVQVNVLRTGRLEEDSDDQDADSPSLFRISVFYTVRNPDGRGWIGPTLELQKCATEENDVASMFEMPGSRRPDHREPYLGRIRPLLADCRLFKRWKDDCLADHHGNCGHWFSGEKPSKIRLIDVKQECIVDCSRDVNWITLSYLWGKTNVLTLKNHSLSEFQRPGFLSRDRVPRTVYDAMTLTAALGETYLWVDSLCIVQDDQLDNLEIRPRIDAIFGRSILTIIDGAGSDAQSGLPGIRQASRSKLQVPFKVEGVTLVQALDPINANSIGYLTESQWNSNGWTLQEAILSPRLLIFTAEQVYWQCNEASWCEDGFWEAPNSPTMYRHFLDHELRDIWSSGRKCAEKRYRQLVEVYSKRSLTDESDVLNAFNGIIGALERVSGLQFHWGLPTKYFGAALTWPALEKEPGIRRRTALCKNFQGQVTECPFPSWSWMGWVGKIHFDEVFGVLTSKHAGIIFYKIYPDGNPEIIRQSSSFKEARARTRKKAFSRPDWRDESRTAITKTDIPSVVFSRNISAIVLGFWSSAIIVTVQYMHDGRQWDLDIRSNHPMVMHKGTEIQVWWGQLPQHPDDLEAEDARLIIVGRSTRGCYRDREELIAIVADREDDEGLTYRTAMVCIDQSDWGDLDDRTWERIFLA